MGLQNSSAADTPGVTQASRNHMTAADLLTHLCDYPHSLPVVHASFSACKLTAVFFAVDLCPS